MCMLAPHAEAQGFASQVSAGYYDASVPTWLPADPTPVSTPFSFGVLWNGSWAPPTTFTITPPDSDPLPVQGAWAYPVAWNAYCQPTQFVLQNNGTIQANLRQNGTWHVVVKVTIMPGIPPWLPDVTVSLPGDVQVAHLSVDSVAWSTTDPGASVQVVEPFVGVRGPGPVGMTYSVDLGDGYETPSWLDADLTVELHGLSGGLGVTEVLTGLAPPPCEVQNMPAGPVTPGLYYTQVLVNEPPGDVDSAEYLSRYLSIDSLSCTGHIYTGCRSASLLLQVDQDSTISPTAWAKEHKHATREPDRGHMRVVQGGALTEEVVTLETDPYHFELAGTYIQAVSLKDQFGDRYHNGQDRWCEPKAVTFRVPAAACYTGYGGAEMEAVFVGCCEAAYARLGTVLAVGDQGCTFYSATHEEGTRGGVVSGTAGLKGDNFLEALQEDEVVYFAGHGTQTELYLTSDILNEGRRVTTEEILGAPDGFEQLRLAFLDSCNSDTDPGTGQPSPAEAVHSKGAQVVVGIAGEGDGSELGLWLTSRMWALWASAGVGIWPGIEQACAEFEVRYSGLVAAPYRTHPEEFCGNPIVPAFTA